MNNEIKISNKNSNLISEIMNNKKFIDIKSINWYKKVINNEKLHNKNEKQMIINQKTDIKILNEIKSLKSINEINDSDINNILVSINDLFKLKGLYLYHHHVLKHLNICFKCLNDNKVINNDKFLKNINIVVKNYNKFNEIKV